MLSYALLSPDEANALQLGAVVSSGVLDAADVGAAAGYDAGDALESLADAQLVRPLEIGRYGMHELMRLFARERWEEEVDESLRRTALERLASHYVEEAPARLSEFRSGASAADALAWFDARRRVVQDIVGELGDGTADDLVIALVFAVTEFSVPLEAYAEMLSFALVGRAAAERAGDDDAAIRCSLNAAIARQQLGELSEAEAELQATAELARSREDPLNEARALAQLGLIHKNRRQPQAAREFLERATERYADSSDQVGAARALGDLANVLDDLGEHAEASSRHRQAIERFRALGDRLGEALEWGNLSISLANEGNFDGAFDAASRADVLWTDLGALRYRARGQEKWGEIALRAGDEAIAEEHYEQATSILAEIGDPTAEARLHWQRSKVRTEVGQFDAARSDLERASRMFAELGDTATLALVRGAMAYLLETMGDTHAARATYLDAVAAFEAANAHPHAHGAALAGLAGIYIADGDIRGARPALERAVALLDDDQTGFADEVREMLHDVTDALGEEANG